MNFLTIIDPGEIFGPLNITNENSFNRLVGMHSPSNSGFILMNAAVLLGLFPLPGNARFEVSGTKLSGFWLVQNFLTSVLLPPETNKKLRTSPAVAGRQVFFRHQILFLLKKLLLLGNDRSTRDPQRNQQDMHSLGRLAVFSSNFVMSEFPTDDSGIPSPEGVLCETLPGFEMENPPDIIIAIARTLSILEIFQDREPEFTDGLSLDSYFARQTGIRLSAFLELVFAIYSRYINLTGPSEPTFLNQLPNIFNFDAQTHFRFLDLKEGELDAFLSLVSCPLDAYRSKLEEATTTTVQFRFDFTVFRRYPIAFLDEHIFTCLDVGFLVEKASHGLVRTVHNSLPDDTQSPGRKLRTLENRFSSCWGGAVEQYVAEMLNGLRGYYPNVEFRLGRSQQLQIDGLFHNEDDLVLAEVKGKFLSAEAKYSGGDRLLAELDSKFGRKDRENGKGERGAVQQIATQIEKIFGESVDSGRITVAGGPHAALEARTIFPIMIADEGCFRFDFAQLLVARWFGEVIKKKRLRRSLTVRPLFVLPIELLEWIEPLLKSGDLTILELARCYATSVENGLPIAKTNSYSIVDDVLETKNLERPPKRNERMSRKYDDFIEDLIKRTGEKMSEITGADC